MPERTHYDSLKLSPHASQADIHREWVLLSVKFSPNMVQDLNVPYSEKHAMIDKYEDALHAYRVLKDPESRQQYDEVLRTKSKEDTGPDDVAIEGVDQVNKDKVIEKTVTGHRIIFKLTDDNWNVCYLSRYTNINKLDSYTFSTHYRGAIRGTFCAKIKCNWKRNIFVYCDSGWKVTVSLSPLLARVHCFGVRNTILFGGIRDLLEFTMSDMEFVCPQRDSGATKKAICVQIQLAPWDRWRLGDVENRLIEREDGLYSIAIHVRFKWKSLRSRKVDPPIVCVMDVGSKPEETPEETPNALQSVTDRAITSRALELATLL